MLPTKTGILLTYLRHCEKITLMKNPRKPVATSINNLQEELDLVDMWRVLKEPRKKSFTWSQNFPTIF